MHADPSHQLCRPLWEETRHDAMRSSGLHTASSQTQGRRTCSRQSAAACALQHANKDRLTDPASMAEQLTVLCRCGAACQCLECSEPPTPQEHPASCAAEAAPASARDVQEGWARTSSAHRPALLRPSLPVLRMASFSFTPRSPPKGVATAPCRQGKGQSGRRQNACRRMMS